MIDGGTSVRLFLSCSTLMLNERSDDVFFSQSTMEQQSFTVPVSNLLPNHLPFVPHSIVPSFLPVQKERVRTKGVSTRLKKLVRRKMIRMNLLLRLGRW